MASERAKEISNSQRSELADRIIRALKENDPAGWTKTWDASLFVPRNPCTKTVYSGINRLWLSLHADRKGFQDPRWITFDEARKNGWHVKAGEKSTYVEKWAKVYVGTDDDGNKDFIPYGKVKPAERQELVEKGYELIYNLQRVTPVFNAAQVEGIPELIVPKPVGREEQYEIADRYIELSPCKVIEKPSDRAFYRPATDDIHLPPRDSFYSGNDFLATMWHEMAHSTGHSSRLNRPIKNPFGSPAYAREELNAELAAMFTQATMNLDVFGTTFENSIEYLRSWAAQIPDSGEKREAAVKEVLSAVSTASGISDYITKPYLEKYPQPDRDPNIEKMVFKGEKPKAPKAKQEQPFGLDLAAREMKQASAALHTEQQTGHHRSISL